MAGTNHLDCQNNEEEPNIRKLDRAKRILLKKAGDRVDVVEGG